MRSSLLLMTMAAAALVIGACSSDEPAPFEAPEPELQAECKSTSCDCADGAKGKRECKDGKLGACVCAPAAPRCGDAKCDPGETCESCAQDCGQCPTCPDVPACSNAKPPPSKTTAIPELDVKMVAKSKAEIRAELSAWIASATPEVRVVAAALRAPAAGDLPEVNAVRSILASYPDAAEIVRRQLAIAGLDSASTYSALHPPLRTLHTMSDPGQAPADCGGLQLSMRVAKVTVVEEDDDIANDIVYCSIATQAKGGGEMKVTPKTRNLDEGDSQAFSPEEGTFWGQESPRAPDGDLTVKYDCFEVDNGASYSALLKTLATEAKKYAAKEYGESGWISTAVDVLAKVATAALALDGDDSLFHATQTIPASMHRKLTAGATWDIRRSGTHLWSDWDWHLQIEAWGCAKWGGLAR